MMDVCWDWKGQGRLPEDAVGCPDEGYGVEPTVARGDVVVYIAPYTHLMSIYCSGPGFETVSVFEVDAVLSPDLFSRGKSLRMEDARFVFNRFLSDCA